LSSDNQKYMVIGAWFKKHQNLETISTAHFYTVFVCIRRTPLANEGETA
jgi:hypothetical protein